jgi:hypothetical protein
MNALFKDAWLEENEKFRAVRRAENHNGSNTNISSVHRDLETLGKEADYPKRSLAAYGHDCRAATLEG